MLLPHYVSEYPRIDGTGARTHHQPFERSEAHGGIDTLAIANGSQRTTISEVTTYEAERRGLATQQVSCAPRAVFVIDAVKTVAANSSLEPVVRARIHGGRERHRFMKASIEDRNLWNVLAQQLFDGLHTL